MMSCSDIRAAARSAMFHIKDREEFLKNYPEEYREQIDELAGYFEDRVNERIDEMKMEARAKNGK